jgi:hypothetical protein
VNSSSGEITRLLAEMEDRKEDAAPLLFELPYHELRCIAKHHFANAKARLYGELANEPSQ